MSVSEELLHLKELLDTQLSSSPIVCFYLLLSHPVRDYLSLSLQDEAQCTDILNKLATYTPSTEVIKVWFYVHPYSFIF